MITNKKFDVVYEAPVINRSGYGVASDLIFHAIKDYPLFNKVNVVPRPWASCQTRLNTLPGDNEIKEHFVKSMDNFPQPHIHIANTIPYMAKPIGTIFNMCFSAGVEVTECRDHFIQGLNLWSLNVATSQHTKDAYLNSKTKLTKPVEVLHWSTDTKTFNLNAKPDPEVDAILSEVKEAEAFLFVGQLTTGMLYGDRKDVDSLVKTFCEAFKDKQDKPALLLKVSADVFSNFNRDNILERIRLVKQDSNVGIYFIHGELTNAQMAALYSHPKVIANVSFTHGEGFGLPLLEGALCGKPTIVSNWSGHTEFLGDKAVLLEGLIAKIPPHLASEFWLPTSSWFTVDYEKAKEVLIRFYQDKAYRFNECNTKAVTLAKELQDKYCVQTFKNKLHKILDRYLIGI